MKTITPTGLLRPALGALVLGGAAAMGAAIPGAPVSTDKAEVSYRNPAGFTEMDRSFGERTDWLDELSGYVAKRAARTLPDGQRLLVTITDVQRAGRREPWRIGTMSDVRIVRDTTPPRIELNYQLVAQDGAVLKEGSRRLTDLDFMHRAGFHRGELLSHEKNLIDDWMRRDFGTARR
jgi:hypothetical protein